MKTLTFPETEIPIQLSKKSVKRISIRVTSRVVHVNVPRFLPYALAAQFVESEKPWILKTIKTQHKTQRWLPASADYKKDKQAARQLVHNKLAQWNTNYKFSWGRVAIRDQASRWGSCSSKGNLNFNWRIVHLPDHLQDYLIVHELCHLQYPNHSKQFWELVERAIPAYKISRKELKSLTLH